MLRQNKKPKQNKQKKKKNLLGKNEKTLVHKLCEKIRKNHESKRPKNSYKFIQASTNEPKTDVFSAFFFVKIKMDSYKSLQKRSLSESSNGSEDDNYSPNFKKPRTSFYQSPGTVGLVRWPGQYTLTIILIFESKIKYC